MLSNWNHPVDAYGLYPAKSYGPEVPNEAEIARSIAWLEEWSDFLKTFNPRIESSYGLKHSAESWAGDYVSNGAFIEAARRLGYQIKPRDFASPNATFNMSIKRYNDHLRALHQNPHVRCRDHGHVLRPRTVAEFERRRQFWQRNVTISSTVVDAACAAWLAGEFDLSRELIVNTTGAAS
jgi:hypothetical protein